MSLAVEILGLILFLGAHVFVTMRNQRGALISRMGFGPYRGLFALVAIAGLVLIGFGFAIVQYLNHLQQIPGARPTDFPTAPEYLGLALISCGVLALVISIWQYRWGLRYLWGDPFTPIAGVTTEGMQTPVMAVAILLIGIVLFAFFAVLFRLT